MNDASRSDSRAAAPAWLDALFRAIDARDAAAFAGFLTPEVSFRFGSMPVVSGRQAVQAAVQAFFEAIGGCRHRVLRLWSEGSSLVIQGEVSYTRLDRSEVTIPFVNVFALRGAQIAEYLIYIDNGPLWAPAGS